MTMTPEQQEAAQTAVGLAVIAALLATLGIVELVGRWKDARAKEDADTRAKVATLGFVATDERINRFQQRQTRTRDALAAALDRHLDAGRDLDEIIGWTPVEHPSGGIFVALVCGEDVVAGAEALLHEDGAA